MPSDETRRLLRAFGVAVTAYEDFLQAGALPDEMDKAAAELDLRLGEIMALISRLRAASPVSGGQRCCPPAGQQAKRVRRTDRSFPTIAVRKELSVVASAR